MTFVRSRAAIFLLLLGLIAQPVAGAQAQAQGHAQHGPPPPSSQTPSAPPTHSTTPHGAQPPKLESAEPAQAHPAAPVQGRGAGTLPDFSDRAEWPSPIADTMRTGFLLFDLFEFRVGEGSDAIRWDVLGWYGGDRHRAWIKSEGSSTRKAGDADVQLLYGYLIAPFFDFQAGLRYERQWGAGSIGRSSAVLGLQGLAPYDFELEPAIFISEDGDISARLTATKDLLLTQRLILQPRLELAAAIQGVERFGVGEGLNDLEIGLRLRYEMYREFAPYIGASWMRSFGPTARLLRSEGEDTEAFQVSIGVRFWF